MIHTLDLPYLATLPNAKSALKEHRQQNPALYERVFTRNAQTLRYYADLPSACVGQFIADTMVTDDADFLFFHVLENQEIYALYVKGHVVQREQIGLHNTILDSFGYELHQGVQIVLTSEQLPLEYEPAAAPKVISLSLGDIPADYQLVSSGRIQPKHVGGLAVFAIGLIGFVLWSSQPEPIQQSPQIDPWQQWAMEFIAQAPADTALKQVAIALAYHNLLPPDWTSDGVMVSGQTIVMPLKPVTEGQAKLGTIQAFALRYPELSLDIETKQLAFHVAPREKPELVSLGNYPMRLHDALLALGATHVTLTDAMSIGTVSRIKIAATFTDVSPAWFGTIGDSVKSEPVFLQQLSLSNGANNNVTGSLELIIEGVDADL
ncbi:hypothetical protein [Shewanella khirikhana]|uniref:Pilin accessory protein (PilO) n=1 Tax=Shewanella khirikhana TaxID=1965282 RepID=A0ABM7DXN6_9GAMM|nr:hypothetical protein [Shewanella khirikhana]AZQ13264.1 hypothetical protein STH12_04238 [Shewanella khirikhana]